jgi:hypothetical protein
MCVYVCMYVCVYECMCMYVCVCVCVYVYTCHAEDLTQGLKCMLDKLSTAKLHSRLLDVFVFVLWSMCGMFF